MNTLLSYEPERNLINVRLFLGTDGYIDLLNGPEDHGWCFGYTCQERISTFYSIIATGIEVEIAMTSTPPAGLRLHLITDNEDDVRKFTSFHFPLHPPHPYFTSK